VAHATHSLAGTPQHGQPPPRAEAGDDPIKLKALMHSAQIANPIFMKVIPRLGKLSTSVYESTLQSDESIDDNFSFRL
jgi:hypothetical protein